jgi:hypothetical protein
VSAFAAAGLRFWAYVSTGPLTLLTLVNLVLALRSAKPLLKIWLLGVGVGVIERAFTFAYFIPKMLRLMSDELPQSAAVPLAQQWQALNDVRHALLIAAWMVSLKAFAVAYALAPCRARPTQ